MERKYIETVEGSPRPADIYEPHMPGVDVLSNIGELFEAARRALEGEGEPIENLVEGQRAVAIVTPGRMIVYQPCPPPGSMEDERIREMRRLMPPQEERKVAVVSYTMLDALMQDETKTKCIPFLGILMAYAYVGYNVVVFEGHPTAFESGVRGCDVLMVDSGMLPFMQADWGGVAFRVMRPGAKIYVHGRKTFSLMPVARSGNAQGWQYSEPDGEASYANCLLTTLARGTSPSARITSGLPLPDLAGLTNDPDELGWIAGLPFRYDRLDADEVIKIISGIAKWHGLFKNKGEIDAKLALEGKGLVPVHFALRFTKDAEGRRQLLIER
jgi:hypothetical protein